MLVKKSEGVRWWSLELFCNGGFNYNNLTCQCAGLLTEEEKNENNYLMDFVWKSDL